VAERALAAIPMTAEREKFNVWVALLNCEDAYGGEGAEAALMHVLNRCVRACVMLAIGIKQRCLGGGGASCFEFLSARAPTQATHTRTHLLHAIHPSIHPQGAAGG
jgi:hypothetical protein